MKKNQKIIKLTSDNIVEISNLFNEQFGAEAWSIQQIASSFNSGTTHFYGIVDNNTLVCVASILVSVDDINLLDVATKNEYKRQGYAKELLQFLISLKNDHQTFSLEVKSQNIPAINLYLGLGFKTLNIRKKYYKDGDDALCMFLGF